MKRVSSFFLVGSLILVLLTAACGANQTAAPTLVGSTLPAPENTSTPSGVETATAETATTETSAVTSTGLETATLSSTQNVSTETTAAVGSPVAGTTQTPGIPVTGSDILLVECQFCVDNMAHALLVLPDTATFQVVSTTTSSTNTTGTNIKTNCSTIEVNNGKQVVLCSGLEKTPVMLNICTTANACTNFPVTLQACPLAQANPAVPGTNKTQPTPGTGAGTDTPTPAVGTTNTATVSPVTSTPTP